MSRRKVTVVARIRAKAGQENAVRDALLALVPPTTAEMGCISYDLHQSNDDPSLFLFYENWLSRDDLDDHLQSPHLLAWRAKAGALLAEPVDISLWEQLT